MEDWYSGAVRDQGNDAGPYTDNGEPKGCFHTTEGKTYAGARGAYVDNNSWPHFTATYEKSIFQLFQHNPLSRASRSLRNLGGGVQTNTDRIAQIELVGTADINNKDWGDQYVESFPTGYLDGIAKLMRWIEKQLLVPRLSTVRFLPYPQSYGKTSVRLSGPVFDAYSGWLGHQHVPENSHGDPGLLDMVYLLDNPPQLQPQPEEEVMAHRLVDEQRKLVAYVIGDLICDVSFENEPDPTTGKSKPKLIELKSAADNAMYAVFIKKEANAVHWDRAQACVLRALGPRS